LRANSSARPPRSGRPTARRRCFAALLLRLAESLRARQRRIADGALRGPAPAGDAIHRGGAPDPWVRRARGAWHVPGRQPSTGSSRPPEGGRGGPRRRRWVCCDAEFG
jgi:hypothetical protein